MTKRKRCPICEKLFAPQGIKKHTNWCIKQTLRAADKATGITEAAMGPAQIQVGSDSITGPRPAPTGGDADTHDIDLAALTPDAIATRMADFSRGKIYPSVSTFESIVKELKEANLGLVVVVLS